jgi:hypothetical protein
MGVINRSVHSMYMICVTVLNTNRGHTLHRLSFLTTSKYVMHCIKKYPKLLVFLESFINLLEMTLQYLLLILLYFKINPFHTLIYAKFRCDSVYNKRKVLLAVFKGLCRRIYLFPCCVLPYFHTACFVSRSSLLPSNSIGLVWSAFTYCLFPRLHQTVLPRPSYLS